MFYLFDMDGVLVDSEPVITAASIAGLAEYGVHAKPDDFIPFIGAGEDRFVGGVAEKYGAVYRVEMKKTVYEKYLEIVDKQLSVYPNTISTLNALREAGHILGLASSADKIKIDANLKAAAIDRDLFSTIIGGEDVKQKKPFPDIYLMAAERLGANPSDCIVIEDAKNGIAAAKAANMRCVAVTTSFTRKELQNDEPDFIIDDISELVSLTL